MKYITYSLFYLSGVGHQPYQAAASVGAKLSGGLYSCNGRYFGYLTGTEEQIESALLSMSAWGPMVLKSAEALKWATDCLQTACRIDEAGFIMPAVKRKGP